MKKILSALVAITLLSACQKTEHVQDPPFEETNNYEEVCNQYFGGSDNDVLEAIHVNADGSKILAGTSMSVDGDLTGATIPGNPWLVKVDAKGNKVWSRYDNINVYPHIGIAATNNGGYFLLGSVERIDIPLHRLMAPVAGFVEKVDQDGKSLWLKQYGNSKRKNMLLALLPTSDGGAILAGSYGLIINDADGLPNNVNYDGWVLRIDANGNTLWSKTYGGTKTDAFLAISTTPNGGYILAGYTYSNDGDVSGNHDGNGTNIDSYGIDSRGGDAWLAEIDANGKLLWNKAFGGSRGEQFNTVSVTTNGGFVAAGVAHSADGDVNGLPDEKRVGWLLKTDSRGNKEWSKVYSGFDFKASEKTTDGAVLLTGSKDFYNGFILKIDAKGNELFSHMAIDLEKHVGNDIATDGKGNYYISGYAAMQQGTGTPSYNDGWLYCLKNKQ